MKQNRLRKRIFIIFSALCALTFALAWFAYGATFKSNVSMETQEAEVYIPKKSTVEEVAFLLKHANILEDERTFLWVAQLKRFQMPSKGGRYIIQSGWSNNDIINALRIGEEIPVQLTFNNIRTLEDLSSRIASQLALDSTEMMSYFNNYDFLHQLGFDFETIVALFIPNTYQVYWTTSAESIFKRMKREYDTFWTAERREKASKIGLSPIEIATIASIIDEETNKGFEKPIMAGVYINRLQRGIPLQACPTLKFALNDFSIKRILNVHKEVESPYNTYKNKGLPPGPIRVASIQAIDAVLNYQQHSYIYFCAKEDFSGEHYFSKTLREHNAYANRYHKALNKHKIYK